MSITLPLIAVIFIVSLVLTMVGLGGGLIFSPMFVLLGFAKSQAASASLFLNLVAAASAAYTYSRKKNGRFFTLHSAYRLLRPRRSGRLISEWSDRYKAFSCNHGCRPGPGGRANAHVPGAGSGKHQHLTARKNHRRRLYRGLYRYSGEGCWASAAASSSCRFSSMYSKHRQRSLPHHRLLSCVFRP